MIKITVAGFWHFAPTRMTCGKWRTSDRGRVCGAGSFGGFTLVRVLPFVVRSSGRDRIATDAALDHRGVEKHHWWCRNSFSSAAGCCGWWRTWYSSSSCARSIIPPAGLAIVRAVNIEPPLRVDPVASAGLPASARNGNSRTGVTARDR